MDTYAGFEPQVGQIRALRTFRLGPGGWLYPLFSNTPWADGTNTARCLRVPAGTGGADPPHLSPEPDCRCGFYAYGSEASAGEYPYARHVRAVISCWGRVIAGTRGLRAEHSRIEALWLSPAVPQDLVAQVAARYPTVAIYRTSDQLLAEHPLTELDCYEPGVAQRWWGRGLTVAAGLAVILGALPMGWLGGSHSAGLAWGICGALFLTLGLALGWRHSHDVGSYRRYLLCMGVALWLLAPFTGGFGLLMIRLPLLEIAALALVRRLRVVRAAGRFPIEIA